MKEAKVIPIRSDLDPVIRGSLSTLKRAEASHILGFVGQATTVLLWVAGFFALVQTMNMK